jgi:hypothetical protein
LAPIKVSANNENKKPPLGKALRARVDISKPASSGLFCFYNLFSVSLLFIAIETTIAVLLSSHDNGRTLLTDVH